VKCCIAMGGRNPGLWRVTNTHTGSQGGRAEAPHKAGGFVPSPWSSVQTAGASPFCSGRQDYPERLQQANGA
jgi:hypothetical protein